MKKLSTILLCITITLLGCNNEKQNKTAVIENEVKNAPKELKSIPKYLPIIGLLAYEGVLMTEVTAPLDVFTKKDTTGKELFNVIVITETEGPIVTEEGLQIISDFTFENAPKLDVLFVPSAYDMYAQVNNEKILAFIKEQNKHTDCTVSNCAGAQLIGHRVLQMEKRSSLGLVAEKSCKRIIQI